MDEILRLFPEPIKQNIDEAVSSSWTSLQEIRFRIGRPIELIFDEKEEWLYQCMPTYQDGIYVINQLSQFSLYRLEDELREGFITIEGGHRIGLAGKVNTVDGKVKAIKHIASFNIRIAKEKLGVANNFINYLYNHAYLNTLIVGPPQTGKTTLLRDIARLISTGHNDIRPYKTGIIDERSEIAGSIKGVPQHRLGIRTDIMDACPKAEGMMMMIRSMSPEVLVVDEIGSEEDVQALLEAIHAGVSIVCSIHGDSLKDLKQRPSLSPLFQQQTFDRYVLLTRETKPGMVQSILTSDGHNIYKKPRCQKNEMDRSTSSTMRYHLGRI